MISNIIAGISLLVSISLAVFYFIDRSRAKFLLENEYANHLLSWHAEVIATLKILGISGRDRTTEKYREELAILSSLIDQGRFFFPNINKDNTFGSHKPTAYRGYRNLALDFLVSSYNLYTRPETDKSQKDAEVLQKNFTSIVFEIVNPEQRLTKIQQLTDRYFLQKKSYEDFLSTKDGKVMEYIWKTK